MGGNLNNIVYTVATLTHCPKEGISSCDCFHILYHPLMCPNASRSSTPEEGGAGGAMPQPALVTGVKLLSRYGRGVGGWWWCWWGWA